MRVNKDKQTNSTMRTIDKIKSDNEFLSGLEIPEYNVSVYLTHIGSDKVQYDMFWNGKLIFTGDDYRPSPMYPGQDSIEAIVALLDFFVLQIGDIDRSYFEKYTPEQVEWRESKDCEELKILTLDFSNDNDELDETDAHNDARVFFEERFIN